MKKTIIALALTGLTAAAFATDYGHMPTPAVTGSATSQSTVAAGSISTVNNVNGFSAHGAFAAAENCTIVSGVAGSGLYNAAAVTGAATEGSTLTKAWGVGTGGAGAEAGQYGYGTVTANGTASKPYSYTPAGYATAKSEVATSTGSAAWIKDSGYAVSGSTGYASQVSAAYANAKPTNVGAAASTGATTVGESKTTTFGHASYGVGDGVSAIGTSANAGFADAKITVSFSGYANQLPPGTGNCVIGCGNGGGHNNDDKPKGNNGYGNGDDHAPGNSLEHNNAENGHGSHGPNGKPRNRN